MIMVMVVVRFLSGRPRPHRPHFSLGLLVWKWIAWQRERRRWRQGSQAAGALVHPISADLTSAAEGGRIASDAVLIVVILPVVVYLLRSVLLAARSFVPPPDPVVPVTVPEPYSEPVLLAPQGELKSHPDTSSSEQTPRRSDR